ncbi:hypothetical protein WJX72_001706 [[Myrmecia] bisecta]|uniref:Ketoreductase domain-containing protein n=1 Tax=[Myrmecia] bisecta TaxID=41462 RepID=A0AAW1QE97_9CHLO
MCGTEYRLQSNRLDLAPPRQHRALISPSANSKGSVRSGVVLRVCCNMSPGLGLLDSAQRATTAAVESLGLPGIAAVAAGTYCLWTLLRFVRADADLRLLSKRKAPEDAFEDKVVWITGASQGLGAELAKRLAARGARLVLSSRQEGALQKVKEACRGKHAPDGILVLPFDLCANYSVMAEAAAVADSAFLELPGELDSSGVDYLLHNAGASQHAVAEETSADVMEQLFELNTLGPVKLTRAALPYMLSRKKGQIVVVSSMAGKVPSPGQAVYSGAKSALLGYFHALHAEVCDRGVSVTICCPGPVCAADDSRPRSVYGPDGLKQQAAAVSTSGKMPLPRVVELMLRAAYHKLDECWIARHPVLLMGYLMQYCPTLGLRVLRWLGPARAQRIRRGESGYEVQGVLAGAFASKTD